jgi:L-aminopeptidase/D-esterase-like protein
VSRRASLPGAAELFRDTGERAEDTRPVTHTPPGSSRRGTPRQKHTSKITVYVSDEELLALEHARLALRAKHGLAVDRGRVVREAIAVVLADLDERGEDSVLVRRLRHDTGK